MAVHDEGYVMHTINLKLDVKKQELDMALDDETRILKQSFCALIYGLIKPETDFTKYNERSSSPCMEKKRTSKYKVTDSFETHSLTH